MIETPKGGSRLAFSTLEVPQNYISFFSSYSGLLSQAKKTCNKPVFSLLPPLLFVQLPQQHIDPFPPEPEDGLFQAVNTQEHMICIKPQQLEWLGPGRVRAFGGEGAPGFEPMRVGKNMQDKSGSRKGGGREKVFATVIPQVVH